LPEQPYLRLLHWQYKTPMIVIPAKAGILTNTIMKRKSFLLVQSGLFTLGGTAGCRIKSGMTELANETADLIG
jgi:hypothetical protein